MLNESHFPTPPKPYKSQPPTQRFTRAGASALATALVAGSAVGLAAQPAAQAGGPLSAAAVVAPASAPDDVWGSFSPLGQGTSDNVNALVLSQDDTLWAGGDFRVASPQNGASGVPNTNRVAAWSDDTWHALGAGMSDLYVYALAAGGDDTLWAGGTFSSASGVANTLKVAAWSDDTWSALATGTTGTVGALTIDRQAGTDDTVYMAGSFLNASGVANTARIAAWADDTWSPLGTGADSTVSALALHDDTVYMGGNFTSASGVANTSKVAAWSGGAWYPLGTGANGWVYALAVHDDTLYMGGTFTSASGTADTGKIAAWSNGSWHSVGSGLNGDVRAFAIDDTRGLVYVGGSFTASGTTGLTAIAAWDTSIQEWIPLQFSPVSDGVNGTVRAIALDDSLVYLGGAFTNAGGDSNGDHIARWTWDPPQGSNAVAAAPGDRITLTGEGLIGLAASGSVRIGSTLASYTRDDSTSLSITVPTLSAGTHHVYVNAVGGEGDIGTVTIASPTPPTPAPAYPPGPPLGVYGVPGDSEVAVTWEEPTSSGSFAITNYQVLATPGGATCLVDAPSLTCTIAELTNGIAYTFTVRALNGAGWGPYSDPSEPLTPEEPRDPTIMISGSRNPTDDKRVFADGVTTDLAGEVVRARVHLAGEVKYYNGSRRTVNTEGTFRWQRRTNKKVYVYFRHDEARSNRIIIDPRP